MASEKEIKTRIRSIKDTQKITNAMYLISSTKLKKARRQLEEAEPFFKELKPNIARALRYFPEINSIYLSNYHPEDEDKKRKHASAYIVITADKGLAGAYNHNILRLAEKQIAKESDYKLFVVGELGRQYFAGKGIPVDRHFLYTAQDPKLSRARAITQSVLPLYDKGEIDQVYIIYTMMKNSVTEEAVFEQLLPSRREDYVNEASNREKFEVKKIEMWPSPEAVVDRIMPNYFAGYVYCALVESFACEQNARMTAMKAANDSANDMLRQLNIQYNHIRQASITQEITEIIAGARALKR